MVKCTLAACLSSKQQAAAAAAALELQQPLANSSSKQQQHQQQPLANTLEDGSQANEVSWHQERERDVSVAVHGDGFTLCGLEGDLMWITRSASWFEVKVRAVMGMGIG